MTGTAVKPTLIDRLMVLINEKLAPVMGAFGENKVIQSIVQGLVGAVPITFVGAFFLLFLVAASTVPFLKAFVPAATTGFSLTLGIIGLFVAVSVGSSYARLYKLNQLTATLICMAAFFTITVKVDTTTSTISIANFGSTGIFPAILTSLIAMRIYRFTVEKNITIKMPAGVPPMISNMFGAMIPCFVIILTTWFIRSVLNFDLAIFLSTLLAPLFRGADNIWVMSLRILIGMLFWSVGLHGEAMLGGVTAPFQAVWQTANASAAVAGQPLPYIWVGTFDRIVLWVPSVWGLMFWMYLSKVKSLRSLAIASTPAALFTIVEPIIFGLPIAFNPYLIIPFVLSTLITADLSYLGTMAGIFSRFYVGLPWIIPPPILAVLDSGGHIANLFMVVIGLVVGILLYWPFFKAFEKKELEKEAAAAEAEELTA